MGKLHELYSRLFNLVVEDDMESQSYYLQLVSKRRNISVEYLQSIGMIFIPNNNYIYHYLGEEAKSYNCGLYYNDTCPWTNFFLIPIMDLSGEIQGLVGWDVYNKFREETLGEQGLAAYKCSPSTVFKRDKYFLCDVDCLKEKFDCRTIFVTDGVFDAVSLNYRGVPAIALLGSSFSPEIIYFLSWYKNIYVCADNDAAGNRLYSRLKKSLSGVHKVVQNKYKDIEELLRNDGLSGPVTKQLQSVVDCKSAGQDIYLTTGRPVFKIPTGLTEMNLQNSDK